MLRRCRLTAALVLLIVGVPCAAQSIVEQGRYLIHAGGCIDCHTAEEQGAIPLAGGRKLDSPFGVFYAPNITPDIATGIGRWTDDDFVNAFWAGVNPDGDHYYPSFPYTSYTGVSREDLLAMKAYLFSLEPVDNHVPEHDLAWFVSSRLAAGAWKQQYFSARRFSPVESRSTEWNRGAYLVRHLGHCGECHTPRGATGAILYEREFAGNSDTPSGESMPNISQHRDDGIGRWTIDDIEYFLDTGMLPDGDYTGSSMSNVIDNNTSKLTRADRIAIATYLKSVPEQESSD